MCTHAPPRAASPADGAGTWARSSQRQTRRRRLSRRTSCPSRTAYWRGAGVRRSRTHQDRQRRA
eukprot:4856627-Prymnesium_polylepis.1